MKLSIDAELFYNFTHDTQVIADLEASRTTDQIILSESLDIQPPVKFYPILLLTVTGVFGPRSRAMSPSGIEPWSKITSDNCFRWPACSTYGPTFQARFYRFFAQPLLPVR